MRVREILEAFDTDVPANIEWEQKKGQINAYFRDPTGGEMAVGFKQLAPDTVEVGFARTNQQGKWSQGRTGTGGASTTGIMGQVIAVTKEYMSTHPEVTHLAIGRVDDDAKKVQLYRKMVDRLAPELGLTVTEPLNVPKSAENMSIVLNRKSTAPKAPAPTAPARSGGGSGSFKGPLPMGGGGGMGGGNIMHDLNPLKIPYTEGQMP
jgi:hypothetical protein